MKQILILFIIFLSCKDNEIESKANKSITTIEKHEIMIKQDIDLELLKEITLEKALENYIKPKKINEFNLNNVTYTEFRIILKNHFSKEQINQAITIKEVTWDFKTDSLVTVWYQEKEEKWLPLDLSVYSKFTEF
ncbi:hypothetical protein [Lacinutrix mariniflava]|uniref:hypothetical protein n=1 Tax=Lacinutrix mariniflava TaxID=342955 RepID=UPI0006E2AF4E|nr:hypothetical protein [Lacinutrix mariniflava]